MTDLVDPTRKPTDEETIDALIVERDQARSDARWLGAFSLVALVIIGIVVVTAFSYYVRADVFEKSTNDAIAANRDFDIQNRQLRGSLDAATERIEWLTKRNNLPKINGTERLVGRTFVTKNVQFENRVYTDVYGNNTVFQDGTVSESLITHRVTAQSKGGITIQLDGKKWVDRKAFIESIVDEAVMPHKPTPTTTPTITGINMKYTHGPQTLEAPVDNPGLHFGQTWFPFPDDKSGNWKGCYYQINDKGDVIDTQCPKSNGTQKQGPIINTVSEPVVVRGNDQSIGMGAQ